MDKLNEETITSKVYHHEYYYDKEGEERIGYFCITPLYNENILIGYWVRARLFKNKKTISRHFNKDAFMVMMKWVRSDVINLLV